MNHNIFASIATDSYENTGAKSSNKSHPGYQCTKGWRVKLLHFNRHHYIHLHNNCKVPCRNSKRHQRPCKIFWSCRRKIPKTNIIIPLWISYYMPQKQQNTIRQTTPKVYNQFISAITESLIWLKIIIDTGNKLKVET